MPLNLVVFRYYHWLVFATLIKAQYEARGEKVMFVTKRNNFRFLTNAGLVHRQDFIAFAEAAGTMKKSPDDSFNVIVHHHPSSIVEWDQIVPKDQPNLSISFYADGYTNRLVGEAGISAFLAERPEIVRRHLFFAQVFQPQGGSHLRPFERITMPFSDLKHVFDYPLFRDTARDAAKKIAKFAKKQPVLIAALRPWGSATFAKGAVAFDNPEDQFARIIMATIAAIEADQGKTFALLIRPDSRSREFMDNTLLSLTHQLGKRKFLDLNTVWPDYLALEPLLGNLPDSGVGNDFVVASFDSTASIPFIGLGIGKSHYLGSPENVVRQFAESGSSLAFLTVRMGMLKGFVADLEKSAPIRVCHHDDMFVSTHLVADGAAAQT